jgi:hypothetical protein
MSGPVLSGAVEPWRRLEIGAIDHRFYGPDPGDISDQSLVSPPLQVGAGPFSFAFQHAYAFEFSSGIYWDGGVIEISDNGGGTWTDIGVLVTPGYGGTITTTSGNPLGGRAGFVNQSAGYPALLSATAGLGTTYAGKTVQIRFRLGADGGVGAAGWTVDNLVFTGLLNQPFLGPVADPGPCTPVAVEEPLPAELSFALAGANPASERTGFRFALPRAARVRITIHDVSGRRIATVADGNFAAGAHTAVWGSVQGGTAPGPGVYFARMTADGRELTRRLVVLSR